MSGDAGAVAVLLGAGRGDRLGGDEPKSFVELGGRSLLAHAVALADASQEIGGFVVTVPPGREGDAERLAAGSPKLLGVVPGGPTRQASVAGALHSLPRGFHTVVCHDVARPLAGPDLVSAVVAALDEADGAIPCVPLADTVKRLRERLVVGTLPRDDLDVAQTPQAFRRQALESAHRRAAEEGAEGTDDAALLERAGFRVVAVPGDPLNVKVTTPEDLRLAEALLAERAGRAAP